jgi:catechol-2,3-dioxygenase
MNNLGLNHYNLRAPRALLESLCAFYCNVVGLRIGDRPALASFGYWLYAGDRDVLHLSEAAEGEQRSTGALGTFDHVAFTCTGRMGFQQTLQRHAIPYEVGRIPRTGQVQLFLVDPAGNGIELNFASDQA